jgi:hypothetical protein
MAHDGRTYLMGFITAGPSAEHADAALAFVFAAWASLPPDGPADPADLALVDAFSRWRETKGLSADRISKPSTGDPPTMIITFSGDIPAEFADRVIVALRKHNPR